MSPRIYKRLPLAERFWAMVERRGEDECWPWQGATYRGYGKINIGARRPEWAHRVAWFLEHGEYPPVGLEIDHLCRNPSCVNHRHLEAVSHRENMLRAESPMMRLHREGRCQNGHPRSEAYIRRGTNRVVYCRACRREKRRA